MNDHESPEDKVKRLEAELIRLKVERDKDKTAASIQKCWGDFTQAEFDAAMRNTGVLERVIAQLERGARDE